MRISPDLRSQVVERADRRCEYCLIHEDDAGFPHEVDHVVSLQHGGQSSLDNLAYACMVCNRFKGTNIASWHVAGTIVRLFNPRADRWNDHLRLERAVIEPLTAIGEVTCRLLRLNDAKRVVERDILQRLGRYPRTNARTIE